MENRAFGVLVTALLLCCAVAFPANSEPLRILYAEPFKAQTNSAPGVQKAGPENLRVRAFGRTFDLELEDNSRLLRATSAATRAQLGAVQLLKGTIKDAPGSWVRLTVQGGRYSGAFWDGADLYAIAAREAIGSALLVPMQAGATGIYRLSDTQGGLFAGTCAVAGATPDSSVSPTVRFRSLVRELRAAAEVAFAAATREIEIAMVGDFEFTSRRGSAAVSTMLDRMNVVDGIFGNQVGVATIPTDFITFASDTDPFTSSDASTLLNQFADYRNGTSAVRGRGLAHLLTGRQLNGNVIGIAFLGSLCLAREGSGVTESSDLIDSPLVMAHEIGHNFGAPHDGETGSPCAGTARSFLMSPQFNLSSTFSACSRQQMQPRIDAAACVGTARNRDLEVSTSSDHIEAVVNEPFQYQVDVTSVGEVAALNGVLTVEVPQLAVQILSASMPGVACSTGSSVRCDLGNLAPGESRRLTLSLKALSAGVGNVVSAVTSTGDVNLANNIRSASINAVVARAIALTVNPQPISVPTDQPFDLFYDVASIGAQPLSDVRLNIVADSLRALAASVPGGTCTVQPQPSIVNCVLGSIAVGAPRRVQVLWVADLAGVRTGSAAAFEANVPSALVRADFSVQALAARDIVLSSTQSVERVAVGQDATFSLRIDSAGANAVDNVILQLTYVPEVTLTVDGPLASSCTTVPGRTDCALGSMPSQSTRTVQFSARADTIIHSGITANAILPALDDVPGNETVLFRLEVRLPNDIVLNASGQQSGFDGRPQSYFATVEARGAQPSENVRLNVTLPTGFVAQSALINNQHPCPIDTAEPHRVSCPLGRVTDGANVRLDFVAPEPGVRTGSI
jgi:hypothetical protein